MDSRHVSIVIGRGAGEVYEYMADVDNLPRWAAGLAESPVARDGDALLIDSPMGAIRVVFVGRNPYGVLDHDVELPTGEVVYNPLRVVPHPEGAEVIFTVRRLGMSDEQFERDVAAVAADLRRLREVLEAGRG